MQMNQPHATLAAPVAPLTWEVSAELDGAVAETPRIPLRFRGPLEIVGFHPTVIARSISAPALRIPTLDEIAILIDVNDQERLTNRLENVTAAGGERAFVTLSAMSALLVPRLVRVELANASPDVGVAFRWKIPVAAGADPTHEDVLVSLAFFCRYIEGESR